MPQPDAPQAPAVAHGPDLIVEALTAFCDLTLDVIQERDKEIDSLRADLRLARESVIALERALLMNPRALRALIH